ncbi:MAG: DUF1329 domain-containing protein [Rugosibacter sp.]|nr:MAG: DUF1329 domain-containing protein [Rugosibacter sp.]TBR10766.1 MAG: DUF1329 domain-containing protein [Rugosibacter sp.]
MMLRMKKHAAPIIASLMMGVVMGTACAATDAEIDAFMNPYAKGFPSASGVKEGVVIDKNNADQFKDVLPPRVLDQIKAGNATITVGKQLSNPAPAGFIEASKKSAASAKVQFGTGKIEGYKGGMPFPYEPSASDPNAGEKLAWNNRYSLEVPDDINIDPFVWEYRDAKTGKINRTVTFGPGALSNTGNRTMHAPVNLPGSDEFYNMINLAVKAPQDLKDTAVLFKRRVDSSKDDDGQLYLGFQRRARRLSTAATTDPFLGSNVMIEEFRGFNGKVNDFTWKYVGTKNLLFPYYKHGSGKLREEYKVADWKYTAFHGQGGCWSDAPWSLRKVYIVEMVPKRADHPISKRTLYFDAESFHGAVSEVYDRKGEFWKLWALGIGHSSGQLPAAAKEGRWTWDSGSMIDIQAGQCTTLNFRVSLEPVPPSVYTIEYIRSRQ